MKSFRYLGRVISEAYDNWPAVVRNLARTRAVCNRTKRTLRREGAEPQVPGFFLKTVVQAVLLFGSETWVVKPCMGRVLGGVPVPGGAAFDGADPAAEGRR